MKRIGFIGLGNMGTPMAANLVKAGFEVAGFDLSSSHLESAKTFGVTPVSSAADAAMKADVVITMLPSGKDTLAVWRDAGTLQTAAPGTLFIDCSTIDVATAKLSHDIAREAEMQPLDAPVSGGVFGAEEGTLTLMVGGENAAFNKAKPILEHVGARVIHCGDAGMGQAAKICNNMMLGINFIATSEAFVLAEKLGLAKDSVFDVVSTSSGQTWVMNKYCPVPGPVPSSPASNGYKPGFSVALMAKDLGLSQEAARETGAVTPLGGEASQLYRLYEEAGAGDVDCSSIVRFLRGHPRSGE